MSAFFYLYLFQGHHFVSWRQGALTRHLKMVHFGRQQIRSNITEA